MRGLLAREVFVDSVCLPERADVNVGPYRSAKSSSIHFVTTLIAS